MKKILAVDDSAVIRLYLEESLTEKGYFVITAKEGGDALNKIYENADHFDAFIIDLIMSGMDGLSLIKHIRELRNYEHSPVVVLTSMDDPETVEEARLAGADCWIQKPFEIDHVLSALDHFLPG